MHTQRKLVFVFSAFAALCAVVFIHEHWYCVDIPFLLSSQELPTLEKVNARFGPPSETLRLASGAILLQPPKNIRHLLPEAAQIGRELAATGRAGSHYSIYSWKSSCWLDRALRITALVADDSGSVIVLYTSTTI